MSKVFKIESNHDAKYLNKMVEKIVNAVIQEPSGEIAIEMDFRVYAYGGLPYNDNNYAGIQLNKRLENYPIKTWGGMRDLYDGDWAIEKICEAIATSKIMVVDFSNSKFYPGALEALLKLKNNTELKQISFKNCEFYNADSKFFAENFADINIDLDQATICQKGINLGVASIGATIEYFVAPEMVDEAIPAIGENADY